MILNPVAVRASYDALGVVGVAETTPHENTGKAVDTYLSSVGLEPGEPWCAAFVYFRLLQASKELKTPLPNGISSMTGKGAAVSWYDYAKRLGSFDAATAGTEPARGDLALFEIEGGIHHIGFVVSYNADTDLIRTVEGNTHPQGELSRDGWGVFARSRSRSEFGAIGGFARLAF